MNIFVIAYNIAGFLIIVTAHIGLVEQRRWEFWLHVVGLLGGLAFPFIVPYANEWFIGTQSTSEVLPFTLMLLQCFWAVLLVVFAISVAYDNKATTGT